MINDIESFGKQEYVLWNAVSVPLLRKLLRFAYLRFLLAGMWAYYTEKNAQYAQNPEVKGLLYEDFEILTIKCIEVTTLTSEHHR